MIENSTTPKAEGLGKIRSTEQKEGSKGLSASESVPQTKDEQLVLDGMMQCLRGMKRSESPGVVNAAREWERIINFRIHMTMQERKRRAKARVLRLQISAAAPTSSQAGERMRLSVSQVLD
jgi:hypothetical protein